MPSFKAFQLLYVADQADFQLELQRYLDNDYIVIADRYDLSSIAYYSSKLSMGAEITFSIFEPLQECLYKPNLTFIFSSNFKDLDERRAGMNKERDAIENNETIFEVKTFAGSRERAKKIVDNWNNNASKIYPQILDILLK